jgi:hypothetical protein
VIKGEDLFTTISSEKGLADLKTTAVKGLKGLKLKGVRVCDIPRIPQLTSLDLSRCPHFRGTSMVRVCGMYVLPHHMTFLLF